MKISNFFGKDPVFTHTQIELETNRLPGIFANMSHVTQRGHQSGKTEHQQTTKDTLIGNQAHSP